jgi:phosphate:Na+ symporter
LGFVSRLIGVGAGLVITLIIHSSSAATAIILTLSGKGLLPWEFAAALVLGSNIGTTIDAVIVSIGTKVNARRAALVHVLFNISGTVLAMCFFHPLLAFVDFLVPGPVESSITVHIAMLHTVFNVCCTLIFLPFTRHIARLTEKLIPQKASEIQQEYSFEFVEPGLRWNAESYIIHAEKEIADMIALALQMFMRLREALQDSRIIDDGFVDFFTQKENYADRMHEDISRYLVRCLEFPMNRDFQTNISIKLSIVGDLENMADDCFNAALLLHRSKEKQMRFAQDDTERLIPYAQLVQKSLDFVGTNINGQLTPEQLVQADAFETEIDLVRKKLKKTARKRIERGADVKSELLYIDLVRNIEKIGDRAFSIAESLAETH